MPEVQIGDAAELENFERRRMRSVPRSGSSQSSVGGTDAQGADGQGRLRPNRSCAFTHSSETMAEPSDISPHR
ncbi:MAG TPA: hypothetical protein VFY53_13730, partial [Rhodoplanes sp.]|nr:hypothetical protein [Rhodoplanes sp.]